MTARTVGGPMTWTTDWVNGAACRGSDPDQLFVQGAAQNRAKLVCLGCRVRPECLADALDHRIEFGVWGGMTERERRALLRRRPEVASWRAVLDGACTGQQPLPAAGVPVFVERMASASLEAQVG